MYVEAEKRDLLMCYMYVEGGGRRVQWEKGKNQVWFLDFQLG